MLRLFELVDGDPRRVRTTFKRIFNIEIIYAHPSNKLGNSRLCPVRFQTTPTRVIHIFGI